MLARLVCVCVCVCVFSGQSSGLNPLHVTAALQDNVSTASVCVCVCVPLHVAAALQDNVSTATVCVCVCVCVCRYT